MRGAERPAGRERKSADRAGDESSLPFSMAPMRLLVLGGTSFLSKQVAHDAVARGHEVVCAARGQSGPAPEGAQLVVVDRDQPGALDPLADERFDAVVDVATGALGWVLDALDVLADRALHWTFVSSINVYADTATTGQGTDAVLHEPVSVTDHLDLFTEMTVELHGGIKVASENAVRDRIGERALVVRPGIISGPGDVMDRFGYWAGRFARGGRAVVPDTPHQPIQHIDVCDLAAWIVSAGEQSLGGTYDAIGPVLELGPVLREAAELVGADDLELVPIDPETLTEAGINPWGGPMSLPLWLPLSMHGLVAHDPTPALAAGLTPRPLADTVHTALDDEHRRGVDRPRTAGLTPAEEQTLLKRAGAATGRGRDQ
jgi:2'-hydroxyisoflavone reductase